MTFTKEFEWFISISQSSEFKAYVEGYAELNFISSGVSEDYTTIHGAERDQQTGKYEDFTVSVDDLIWQKASLLMKGLQKNSTSKESVDLWLRDLRLARDNVSASLFYEHFPKYKEAIIRLGLELRRIRDAWAHPPQRPRNKSRSTKELTHEQKSYELDSYLLAIEKCETHEKAIAYLQGEVDGFIWNELNDKHLFHKSTGEINKKRVSYALEQVAQSLWESYPKATTIKKHLLDGRDLNES